MMKRKDDCRTDSRTRAESKTSFFRVIMEAVEKKGKLNSKVVVAFFATTAQMLRDYYGPN